MEFYETKANGIIRPQQGKNIRIPYEHQKDAMDAFIALNLDEKCRIVAPYLVKANEDVFNGDFYMKEGGGEWRHQAAEDSPLEDLRKQMVEYTYFARFEYSSVKYDGKQKAYTFDKITDSIVDGDHTMEVVYRNGVIAFEGGELVSYKHTMSFNSMTVDISMERTQKGSAEVVVPTIE